MKTTKLIIAILLLIVTFSACKKDKDEVPQLPQPTVENLELGLGDAGIGVINQDFHFEADIVAGDKIEKVEVKILQKAGETYSKVWKHEITWDQYKGLKNTNVHKHFNIPGDAAEGKYDLHMIVYDQNGTQLDVRRDLEIYAAANLPVRPLITGLYVHRNWTPFYDAHGDKDNYPTEPLKKGDTLQAQVNVSYVKGDGKLYMLLVKKSTGYNPKTIEEVDLSKAVVYDVLEHKNEAKVYDFSNFIFDVNTFTVLRDIPNLIIGAENDNNAPTPNAVKGETAWQSGDYNLVIIYKNTTFNQTVSRTIPFTIEY
ncbi:DUF4625 domain-containing protein [Chitinophaga rhizophila]|uniref:DUF4625 domain-containing protein n=1 Tax=Chitinophaga rhizophila TaxID=2866212 RepID=A0ABS7GAF1_9BACT|nr:DUF4625 domain-containing protein [Chitinophaga rhizophila]MBW8684642.1 DUF4625 domain-containing protein [Chitinophaga rhizophila]